LKGSLFDGTGLSPLPGFPFLVTPGSGFLLNLLDLFSSFGRDLLEPVPPNCPRGEQGGRDRARAVGRAHALPRAVVVIAPVSAGVSMAMLMLVATLAATRGRWYCNTVCPVGALLGLLSKISLNRRSAWRFAPAAPFYR
jgi:hypothetical protein